MNDQIPIIQQARRMMKEPSLIEIMIYGLPFVFAVALLTEVISWFDPSAASGLLRIMALAAMLLLGLAFIVAVLRLLFALAAYSRRR